MVAIKKVFYITKYFNCIHVVASIIAVERKGWWFAPPTPTFLLPSGQLFVLYALIKQREP
jgi:hypothetical protein